MRKADVNRFLLGINHGKNLPKYIIYFIIFSEISYHLKKLQKFVFSSISRYITLMRLSE